MPPNGKVYIGPNFSGTDGLGEKFKKLNINIPNDFEGKVKSSIDISPKFKAKNGKIIEKYKKINLLFLNLKLFLKNEYENGYNIDPVKYLYYLYYDPEQKLSTIEIYDRLYHLGDYNSKSKNSFEKMFKDTFKWPLRGNQEESKNTRKRQSNQKNIDLNNPNHINNQRKELENEEIAFLYNNIKGSVENIILNDLVNKKTLNEKIIYILYRLGFLKEENDEELANFVDLFQKKQIGFLKTSQIIKGLIIKIKPELESNINTESLKKRLREKYNKYYKS